jgi:hypothetical protein
MNYCIRWTESAKDINRDPPRFEKPPFPELFAEDEK